MKKQIWHLEVEYEWNTYRILKGVRKDTQKTNKGTFITCSVGDNVKELNEHEFLKSCIRKKIKTTQGVNVKIIGWKWRKKMGISNDVH